MELLVDSWSCGVTLPPPPSAPRPRHGLLESSLFESVPCLSHSPLTVCAVFYGSILFFTYRTHTEIRELAIRREMKKMILARKLKETADDWATPVESLTSNVKKHAET